MNNEKSLKHYKTLIFDCDGVVLNSNKVKTEAFYKASLPYGEIAAQEMVRYHLENGGISRYKKFVYFLEKIVPIYAKLEGPELDVMLKRFSEYVRLGLLKCEIAPGLNELRKQTAKARWFIVSGGDQLELQEIFIKRGIAEWFDGGIFGSPRSKDEILANEIEKDSINKPAIFFGDSKYDYQAAHAVGFDFIFITEWSEVMNWKEWVTANQINFITNLATLLKRNKSLS